MTIDYLTVVFKLWYNCYGKGGEYAHERISTAK